MPMLSATSFSRSVTLRSGSTVLFIQCISWCNSKRNQSRHDCHEHIPLNQLVSVLQYQNIEITHLVAENITQTLQSCRLWGSAGHDDHVHANAIRDELTRVALS